MLGPSEFRELVNDRRRGLGASLLRVGLRLIEWPYTWAVKWRNRRYDRRLAMIRRIDVPVVSVGNITLGGTGKTPTVEWLATWFADQGLRVGLVSRGYGAHPGQLNDEALELAQKLPQVPHVLDADRVRGAQRAVREFGCQLVLLDDAFQHRRIARDLDIALIDALEPFGFGHVFPRGMLREPLSGLARADVIILTRGQSVTDVERAGIREQVRRYAPAAAWVEATYSPQCLLSPSGNRQELANLIGKRIAAFCGIGNPAGFRHALSACGHQVVAMRELPDHFPFAQPDLDNLMRWADELDVAGVVCTCKDLVKIADRWSSAKPLWALSSRLEITSGQDQLEAALRPLAVQATGTF